MKAGLVPTPIRKILIANRGEIALRIFRAANLLNIPAVFVYAEDEAGSSWISQSAESCSLGNGSVFDTYLNIPKILELAKRTGADAIHPGYGFLSENHRFAEACENSGITFIGPSPGILRLMGDKTAAHQRVASLGINSPERIVKEPAEIMDMKDTIDYPVLVKAAAGGGGKGMRLVNHSHELAGILETTAHEALHSFADDRIYLEKYLAGPRHIEVQMLGDRYGNIVHLFERECSIQRRHQKIIEEAPAVGLSEDLRQQIINAALSIAKAVGYFSAGTIEFLLGSKDDFYFLEMNPRIQVEHCITEMITGIDIVQEQIRIAGGYPLSFTQKDIRINGFAMEARIYAEDPDNNFMPSPGRISLFREPPDKDVRLETAVRNGDVISDGYDPMLAKVLVHSPSREQAIGKLRKALDGMVITGVHHNMTLLKIILDDGEFLRNSISTSYLDHHMAGFVKQANELKHNINPFELVTAALCLSLPRPKKDVASDAPVWQQIGHWRIVPKAEFRIGSENWELVFYHTGKDSLDILQNDGIHKVRNISVDDYQISYALNDRQCLFFYLPWQEEILQITDGLSNFRVERFDISETGALTDDEGHAVPGDGVVLSPMPGKITGIHVLQDEKIEKGDFLMTIESMKLENKILAQHRGIVKQINVHEGDQVKKDTMLMLLTADINQYK